jgi:hypothetical protein
LGSLIRLREARSNSESQHARSHAEAAKHEELASSETIDGEESDEARKEFPGQRTAGEDARGFAVEAETVLEDDLSSTSASV